MVTADVAMSMACTGMLVSKFGQPVGLQGSQGIFYLAAFTIQKDANTRLFKSQEWSHTHTAGDNSLYTISGQKHNRGQAGARLMPMIGYHFHIVDLCLSYCRYCIDITVPEMSGEPGFKPSGKIGRDSDLYHLNPAVTN
jgi:hypothetical protein